MQPQKMMDNIQNTLVNPASLYVSSLIVRRLRSKVERTLAGVPATPTDDSAMPNLPFTINFGSRGDYKLWAGEGWHHDENDEGHTWAGQVAKLKLSLGFTKIDLLLSIDVIPVIAKGVKQELFVFVNGRFGAFWPVERPIEYSARLEPSLFKSGENLISFVVPKAFSPKDEKISEDHRILGLAFRTLTLSEAPPA